VEVNLSFWKFCQHFSPLAQCSFSFMMLLEVSMIDGSQFILLEEREKKRVKST
jgi:hypothetical protein